MNLASQTIYGEQVDPVYVCQFAGETYATHLSAPSGPYESVYVSLGPCENRLKPIPLHDVPYGYFRHWRKDGHRPGQNVPERQHA